MNRATTALAVHRIALTSVALLAPRTAGRLFGLDFDAQPQAAVLTRLMASRNLVLGVGLLVADSTTQPTLLKLNRAVDAIDLVSVAEETRRGAIPVRATVIGMLTSASAAALGRAAQRS